MKPEGYVHAMPDKPASTVHGTGSGEATFWRVKPWTDDDPATDTPLTAPVDVDVRLDRQWIAGATCGFNFGIEGNHEGLKQAIEGRLREIHCVPTPPASPTVTRAVELHLESICALTAEWDSNRMGSVAIHKKRWQKLAAIASDALALLRAAEEQK